MRAARLVAGVALAVLPCISSVAWTWGSRTVAPRVDGDAALTAASCAICHPAAKKALGYGLHAALLTRDDTRANVCAACHGAQKEHVESALDPLRARIRATSVDSAACLTCHVGRSLTPAQGAHPWSSQLDRVPEPPPPSLVPSVPQVTPSTAQAGDDALRDYDFRAVARAGYRFVNVFGSRQRYETDLNLDGGVRMTDLELHATGQGDSAFDRASLTLTDLADPYMRLRGELAKDGLGTAKARFEKDAFKYRARGDFHRVDLRAQEWGFDVFVPLAKDTELTTSFTRRLQDSFWLTSRIGNRNVNPQVPVQDVVSPRDHDFNQVEVAVQTRAAGANLRAGVEYRAHQDVDSFAYQRTSPVNPAFPESEDFVSKSTLRGPGASLGLSDRSDGLSWSLTGRVLTLERRIRGNGVRRGFDISDFTTTTSAFATGEAETWLVDGTLTWDFAERWSVLGDLRVRDHREKLGIDQVDVTVYPSLGNSSSVALDLDQRTTQRTFDGSLSLQFTPLDGVRLLAGYGFVNERLRVPDLDRGDSDFARGYLHNHGVLLEGEWRPSERWTALVRYRDFGQNGMQLHEITDDEVRTEKAKLRYQASRFAVEGFTEHRAKDNDISSTRLRAWTSGLTLSVPTSAQTTWWTTYAYTDLESRTLTNFYFDPSPTPVPTFVGFDGTTHTVSAGLGLELTQRVRFDLAAAYTSTRGTFGVQTFDWRADLSAQVCSSADVGILVRQVDYQEDVGLSGGLDDYGSYLTFLYVRTRAK